MAATSDIKSIFTKKFVIPENKDIDTKITFLGGLRKIVCPKIDLMAAILKSKMADPRINSEFFYTKFPTPLSLGF